MKIAVTGSHGLIGEALCKHLTGQGHTVARIIRASNSTNGDIRWNPANASIESDKLNDVDAVIHLAGENIASHRWTSEQKQKIKESRIRGTKLLAETICGLEKKPEVVVSGSAIGFYGDRGSETLTESSNVGSGFLADVCREWEEAIAPVAASGVRVVNARTGVVLSTKAGALNKMLPIFQLGGGGNIGDGRQYMSWISLDDEVKALEFALTHSSVSGPVNLVAPNPVTNAEFTAVLGSVLHRPAFIPLPAFAAKIILGEMADELLLSSQKCQPTKLLSAGYQFEYPELKKALSMTLQENK
ncbi:MAG TPA: TIGR01777 family oxidoreductase [Oculatellaceae cyanobacterium]